MLPLPCYTIAYARAAVEATSAAYSLPRVWDGDGRCVGLAHGRAECLATCLARLACLLVAAAACSLVVPTR
ncbi:hypothetical protein E2562_024074 [Oryza meyeriana var. granulata]|uniref:Uncharacterized protein n=1 Tax=Oryza meyeriana var. granulata TaxID=110450 RepID=A0A6G1CI88_9ORYZ|nr:hypothetical protein E2562_024074 [Oryza meyeriana var. granulata]